MREQRREIGKSSGGIEKLISLAKKGNRRNRRERNFEIFVLFHNVRQL